jgi:hypothetical protein
MTKQTIVATLENNLLIIRDDAQKLLHSSSHIDATQISFLDRYQLVISFKEEMKLWDIRQHTFTKSLKCKNGVHNINGIYVAYFQRYKRVFDVWNSQTNQTMSFQQDTPIYGLVWLDDYRIIAQTKDSIHVWDLNNKASTTFTTDVTIIDATCVWDRNTIVLSVRDSLCVLDLNTRNKRVVTTNFADDTGISSMKRISENGCRLLMLYYQNMESYEFSTGSAPRSLSIFNMKTKSVETVIYECYTKNPSMPVYYAIQGKMLYYLLDNQVCVYDLDMKQVMTRQGAKNVTGLAVFRSTR